MKTKICTNKNCKHPEKPISKFIKDKNRRGGLQPWCKECVKEYTIKYQEDNRKEIAKQRKEYRDTHKEEISKKGKEYCDNNKEKLAIKSKKYRDNNKEKIAKINKQYRDKPENKEKIAKKKKEWQGNKRKTDINFKIKCILRTRIWEALRGLTKTVSTMFLIGCEIDYLMYYIQEQFTEGMSWDNYGFYGWHIDHIKPCSLFDLTKESEQFKCFNFKNLQPLWAEDNRRKGNKFII